MKSPIAALFLASSVWAQSGSPLLTIDSIKVLKTDKSDQFTTESSSSSGGVFSYTISTVTGTIGLRTGKGTFTIVPPTARALDGPDSVTFNDPATFVVTQTWDSVLTVTAQVRADSGSTCFKCRTTCSA